MDGTDATECLTGEEPPPEPGDLAAALDGVFDARRAWDAFPRAARLAILEWVGSATTPETRSRRIEQTVTETAAGRRANQWRQPNAPDASP